MFNLTSKKYIFFAISLLVLVPGIISLLFNRLNTGIDFTGGTTIDLVFQNVMPAGGTTTVANTFQQSLGAKDVKIYLSSALNTQTTQTFWVETDVQVDSATDTEILNRLQSNPNASTLFGTVQAATPLNVTVAGKAYSLLPFVFTPPPSTKGGAAFKVNAADIQKVVTATALTTSATTIAATATPAAPTATPAAPTATPTTGSTTPTTPSTTTPVKITNIYESTTNQIVTVQTQTQLKPNQLNTVETELLQKFGPLYQSQVQSVGPSIASSTTFWAVFAVFLASIAILIYVTFAFRNVGSLAQSFRYGACAIIALLHDALVVLGIWSILGALFPNDFKVDTLFVTAVLTVIGFSVHDTIVVFDRIRENMKRRSVETFNDIVNASLLQTMARSLNTSLTVLLTLSALVLFGGDSIRSFTLALLIGIFSGTYSSIFNASMLLVMWENREWRTWFGRTDDRDLPVTRGNQRLARAGSR